MVAVVAVTPVVVIAVVEVVAVAAAVVVDSSHNDFAEASRRAEWVPFPGPAWASPRGCLHAVEVASME